MHDISLERVHSRVEVAYVMCHQHQIVLLMVVADRSRTRRCRAQLVDTGPSHSAGNRSAFRGASECHLLSVGYGACSGQNHPSEDNATLHWTKFPYQGTTPSIKGQRHPSAAHQTEICQPANPNHHFWRSLHI